MTGPRGDAPAPNSPGVPNTPGMAAELRDAAGALAWRARTSAGSASVRALLIGAAACGLLALGLPWGRAYGDIYLPGSYWPGLCSNVMGADGYWYTECTPGVFTFGTTLSGSDGAIGAQTAVRVFVALAALATAVALRRRSGVWARAAVLVAATGLLLGGLGARPGQVVYLAGGLLLALALRKTGLLVSARPQVPATAPPSPGTARVAPGPAKSSPTTHP